MSDAVPAILICTLLFIIPSELPAPPTFLADRWPFSSKPKSESVSPQLQRPSGGENEADDAGGDGGGGGIGMENQLLQQQPDKQHEDKQQHSEKRHNNQQSDAKSKRKRRRRVPRLLDWDTVHVKMPWCIILIMGGGLAMAEGMIETRLSEWLGEQFSVFSSGEISFLLWECCDCSSVIDDPVVVLSLSSHSKCEQHIPFSLLPSNPRIFILFQSLSGVCRSSSGLWSP